MNIFTNTNGKLFQTVEKIGNLIVLNFLYILFCIPIVTIGPATAAMHYVTLKMIRDEEDVILRPFLHSFKQNLKQGVVVGLITFGVGVFLSFDLYYIYQMMMAGALLDKIVFVVVLFAFLVYWMLTVYIFPLLAQFDNSTKQMFRTAAILAIRHLPATLCMGVISLAPVVLLMYTPQTGLVSMLFYAILGFAAVALMQDKLMVRIFNQYIPAETSGEEIEEVG